MPATRLRRAAFGGVALAILVAGCTSSKQKAETELRTFIQQHEQTLRPLQKDAGLAAWKASITGADADYEDSKTKQLALEKLYTDRDAFGRIRAWREAGRVQDPQLRRELEVLYLAYLGNQIPDSLLERMVDVQNDVDRIFSTFRGKVGDASYTDNELRDILRTSNDSARLQAAWEAGKQVGAAVQPKLLEVVRLRNDAAKILGFPNYFSLQMVQQEFDETQLMQLFDELDALTRDSFAAMKAEVDARLAKRYGIPIAALRPWHYHNPFFQEAPDVFAIDLDSIYAKVDILETVRKYYAGVGFDITDILAKSDLYEKEGKNQHAYCTDIDREGDVRVFANIRPNEYWMGTMLHEMGHAVYDKSIDPKLPFLLREASHTLTTEAMAMLFGRMSKNAMWMQQMAGLPEARRVQVEGELRKMLTFEQLTFSRWVQVMLRFERELYSDPNQDLDTLWWDLVECYQLLHRPEGRKAPDYASKYHVAMAPVYYHNYLLGELMASQVHAHLVSDVLHASDPWSVTYVDQPAVGAFLKEKVFGPGTLLSWNELVRNATGSPLSPRAFAAQFVGSPGKI
jgi:peptidyl-dipeptidase A